MGGSSVPCWNCARIGYHRSFALLLFSGYKLYHLQLPDFRKHPSYPSNPPLASANYSLILCTGVSANESQLRTVPTNQSRRRRLSKVLLVFRASMCRHGPGKSTCNAAGAAHGVVAVKPVSRVRRVSVERCKISIGSCWSLITFHRE